jgi:hypothetical protein
VTKEAVTETLLELGRKLGFKVSAEVNASESAWVDVVWFDSKFDFGPTEQDDRWVKLKTWRQPVIPLVGFEIEASANAKTVKGSVANLLNLGAMMSVIVLCKENVTAIRNRAAIHREKPDKDIWKFLERRATQWVYAEARPTGIRIVIMTEPEVNSWARSKGVEVPGG